MKYKDLPQDAQFTILNPEAVENLLHLTGVVFQKQSEEKAFLVDEITFHPETEVQEVSGD